LDPVLTDLALAPPPLALMTLFYWPLSKILASFQTVCVKEFEHTTNVLSINQRPKEERCARCWISQNQKQNSKRFSLRTNTWTINLWRFWKNLQTNNRTTKKSSSASAANIVSKLETFQTANESIFALPQEAQDELCGECMITLSLPRSGACNLAILNCAPVFAPRLLPCACGLVMQYCKVFF